MPASVLPLTEMPDPQYVMSPEGHRIATYSWGDPDAEPVLVVHGFASSCQDNWVNTGWVRDLTRAGHRVIGLDQRGHGASDRPHDAADYSMSALENDIAIVLDTYLVDSARYVGYSLGARVGWQFAVDFPQYVERIVLGGVPDGVPLARVKVDQATAYVENGTPVEDAITHRYVSLAERVPTNDLRALMALAEGMQLASVEPDLAHPPHQPALFATGTEDSIIERSQRLAEAADAEFFPIPGRHHFNAPGSRDFRQRAIAFLAEA